MNRKRRGYFEGAVALVFAATIVIAGGTALYIVSTINPVHTDRASVPSTGTAPAKRYASAAEKVDGLARALLVHENVPGLSVAIARDGDIVWAEGFGFANIERRLPVTPRTRFRTGSVSKTLTAAAVGLLYDRGRIDLDAPIQRYVPDFPEKPWPITTRHLLGDVAGVHRIRGDNNDNVPRGHCTTLDEALESFEGEPLLFEPGTNYRFSTYGWILLSAVIEGAAREPFPAFMRREVIQPLGMDRTVLEGADDDPDDVSFYYPRRTLHVSQGAQDAPAADYSCFFGAGAFLSTPSDLVRLGSATLRPGMLKAGTIALFQTPVQLKSGASTGFALGWRVDRVQLGAAPVRLLRHRANLIGGAVSLSVYPDLGLVVAVTSNVSPGDLVDPFALQVAEAFASSR